jgi:hypothetical protein
MVWMGRLEATENERTPFDVGKYNYHVMAATQSGHMHYEEIKYIERDEQTNIQPDAVYVTTNKSEPMTPRP